MVIGFSMKYLKPPIHLLSGLAVIGGEGDRVADDIHNTVNDAGRAKGLAYGCEHVLLAHHAAVEQGKAWIVIIKTSAVDVSIHAVSPVLMGMEVVQPELLRLLPLGKGPDRYGRGSAQRAPRPRRKETS